MQFHIFGKTNSWQREGAAFVANVLNALFLSQNGCRVRAGALKAPRNMGVRGPLETEVLSSQTPVEALLPLCSP